MAFTNPATPSLTFGMGQLAKAIERMASTF